MQEDDITMKLRITKIICSLTRIGYDAVVGTFCLKPSETWFDIKIQIARTLFLLLVAPSLHSQRYE